MSQLRDYCEFTTKGINVNKHGKMISYTMNFFDPAVYSDKDAWYYITMSHIKENYIEKVSFFSGSREYIKYVLRDGDIVLCKLGPYFRSAIYDNAFPFADPEKVTSKATIVVTENIYILAVDKNRIDPYYIAYILGLPGTKLYFWDVAKGERTKVLNIEDVLNLEIPEYTEEMKKKTKEYKMNLLEMGMHYKEIQEEKMHKCSHAMARSIRIATDDLNEALKSGDINKMRAAVGKVGLSIDINDEK